MEKHGCQDLYEMETSNQESNKKLYQFVSWCTLGIATKFGWVWCNIEKVINIQSQRGNFVRPLSFLPGWKVKLTTKAK